jgi:hypothetical protein
MFGPRLRHLVAEFEAAGHGDDPELARFRRSLTRSSRG